MFKYLKDPILGETFPSRDSFKYLERGMQCVGWLPPPRGNRYYWLYRAWSIFAILAMAVYLPIAFFASYFIDFESFTPGDFLTSLQVAFNAACLALKIIVVVPHMWRFETAKRILDLMDERCIQEEEHTEVHRCVVRCNYAYIVYQVVYSSYATLTYLSSAFSGSTPWGFYLPFVHYQENFWLAATLEYIIGSAAVYCDQLIDLYPLIFGILLRNHMQLVIQRVERLRATATDNNDAESYEMLVNCVKDHKLLLEYCDIFRPIISGTIFAQFLVIGLGLGLSMVNLMFFSNLWTGIATAVFIIVLMIETFPFCYLCELIADDCDTLTSAIFHSNWIDANKSYKATLVAFLHQAQQSINFIAGGIFPISMQTNIEVAKLAFTVVTLVKQMNIVEKLLKD